MEDEGRYYCVAENKFGRETVNGLLLVRSMDIFRLHSNLQVSFVIISGCHTCPVVKLFLFCFFLLYSAVLRGILLFSCLVFCSIRL